MRIKGATVQQWALGAALIFALCWNIARGSEIKDLALTEGATGTRAELLLDSPGDFNTLTLAGPDRLVVDLPASKLGRFKLPEGAGVVKAVRTGQPVPGTIRIVFDLAAPAWFQRQAPTCPGHHPAIRAPGACRPAWIPCAASAPRPARRGRTRCGPCPEPAAPYARP